MNDISIPILGVPVGIFYPWIVPGGVVGHPVHDHVHTAVVGRLYDLLEVVEVDDDQDRRGLAPRLFVMVGEPWPTFIALAGLLILIALYFLFSKRIRLESGEQRISLTAFSVLIGFTVGFYDGFFGPGTGSFFTIAFVLLLGYALPQAIGGTKLLNFTSNVVALGVFILSGHILWVAGIVMGSGQIIGSYLGSHLAVKHGARLIRPMLVTISILMSAKLLLD